MYLFLQITIHINIALAIFNLIPIHPLDGGQIFSNILYKYNPNIAQYLTIYGPRILLAIILIGLLTNVSILWMVIEPIKQLILYVFDYIISFIINIFR